MTEKWICPECGSTKIEWVGHYTSKCNECGHYGDDSEFYGEEDAV